LSAKKAKAKHAVRGKWGRLLARAGLVAKGATFALVAVLALEVVFGKRGSAEDRPGALQTIAEHPFGRFLIAALAIGLGGFAFWCFAQAILGERLERGEEMSILKRVALVALGLLYAALCAMCAALVFGANEPVKSGGGGNHEDVRATRIALEQPLGRYLVIAVGLGIIGAGLFNVYTALTGKFREGLKEQQMGSTERRWYMPLGVAGHIARGVIFALIGVFFIQAAWDYKPKDAVGLDGALTKLAQADYGPVLLGFVAAGLLAYGVFCFVQARYGKV